MFLGEKSAALIASWIKNKEINISKIDLSQNQLGDTGLKNLARVLSLSNSVFYVDLR